jgi:hypothetical protein
LIYLNSLSMRPGSADGMLQAIPGVIAVRPGRYMPSSGSPDADNPGTHQANGQTSQQYDPYPAPPLIAPPTGWQIRPYAAGSSIDTMVTLLFAMRSTTADSAHQIEAIGTRFVGTDQIDGDSVDIMDGAAVPPAEKKPTTTPSQSVASAKPSPSSSGLPFAAQGGQVRYWVDARSRILRVEALVNPTTALEIDFDRADHTAPTAIELLGGAAIKPTPLTTKQADLLARMGLADYHARGGDITLAVPASADHLISATGWLDWRHIALYLAARDNHGHGPDATLRADAAGVTVHGSIEGSGGNTGTARPALVPPTLPPPTTGWKRSSWASRQDAYGQPDLDFMLSEMLSLAAPATDDPAQLKAAGSRLRSDTVDGVHVTVFEVRKVGERGAEPGTGRLRYWVDATGLLRRLEIRTRTGAFAYLTFTPSDFPTLPNPIKASNSD